MTVSRPARRFGAAVCAALGAWVWSAGAVAQTPDAPVENFRLVDWGGHMFVNSFYSNERQTRQGTEPNDRRELYSQQGVELFGKGYIYHPKMVAWSALARIGFSVDNADTNTASGTTGGELLGYDVNAVVLKEKEISGRLFASMQHEFVARSFTEPLQLDVRTEGVSTTYRGPLVATARFDHTVRTEDSDLRFDDKESFRTSLNASATDTDNSTDLNYEHEDVSERLEFRSTGSGIGFDQRLDETRDELNVSNRWTFGEGALKHRLTGQLRALHREGFYNNDVLYAQERLDLMHTDSLSSFFSGAFNYDQSDTQTDRTLRGEAGVTKRFYKNLMLTGRVNVLDRNLEDGLERSLGFYVDADYHKEFSFGKYSTHLTAGRRYEREQFEGGQRQIEDDAVTLTGIDYVALGQAGVVPGSVLLTDANNATRYVEGIDYELRQTGRLTEVRRLVGGGINAGDLVLADYLAQAGRNSRFHQDTFSWSHRVDLAAVPVAVYGLYALREDSLDSGDDPLNLERDQRWLGGVEWTLDDLTLTSEVERRDLQLTPGWNAFRARAGYTLKAGSQSYFNASAHYEMLEYHDADEFNLEPGRDFRESFGVTGDATAKIGRNMLLRLDAIYLRTQGRNNDELIRVGPEVQWLTGDMELTVGGYQAFYRQEDTRGQTTYLMLKLKRNF